MLENAVLLISIFLCIVSAFFLGYYTGYDKGFHAGWIVANTKRSIVWK